MDTGQPNPIRQDADDQTITLESRDVRVLIDPLIGGKIRSFVSKDTGTEFFYVDRRNVVEGGDSYTANHDISGFDDCFPTVWPCTYPDGKRQGMPMGDHGCLWQRPWEATIHNDRVEMTRDVGELQCRCEKTCRLETQRCLRLDYVISNYGDEALKYIYSAHPMLAGGENCTLVVPDEIKKMYVFFARNIEGFTDNTWIDWPAANMADLEPPLSAGRKSVVKLYSPRLKVGKAAVHHPDAKRGLQFEFDTAALPYLGVLYMQGFDLEEGGDFAREIFLGLEPATGIGDDLPTCESTGTVQELAAGDSVSFWIRLTLLDL